MNAKLPTLEEIAEMKYVSLATFRKTGAEVKTPVWIAGVGNTLYIYTEAHVGKVKRIRNNGKARLAKCDLRGKVLGEFVDASARMVEDTAEFDRAFVALKAKYGWQMTVATLLSTISGKLKNRAVIALELV